MQASSAQLCPAPATSARWGETCTRIQTAGFVPHWHRPSVVACSSAAPSCSCCKGGAGLATYQPILGGDGALLGFVNGVFRIDALVDSCLAEASVRQHYRFRLYADDGQLAYAYDAAGESGAWPFTTSTPLRVIDRTWRLEFAPSFQALEQRGNVFADLLALFGVALVGLLAWLLAGRLRAMTALDESQARYRLLVENMADLLIRLGPDGRLLYASPSYCRMFGATEEALLAREGPLAHDGGDGPVASALAAVQAPPHTTVFEQRTATATGPRWFAWSYRAVLNDRGQVEEIVGVGRDVTARRELEEQLRQAQKMQAVGQLAGGIAHDFNNLLHAMLGFMEFAADALQPGHPAREDLGHARAAGQRAAQLTKQLLTFSRRQMLQSFDLDLNEVVENALRMLERIVSERVEIEFHAGPQALPVRGDPVQLEQVLVNLCVNARDAMGGKGLLRIALGESRPDAAWCATHPGAREVDYATLTVSDSGTGMAPETLSRIFEPFFTTKEVGAGTGLGLSTVYGIVQQHEGFVDVWSQPGQGSRFAVYLPRTEAAVFADEPVEKPPAPRGQGTVLVAEDDPGVRQFVSRILRTAGYTVLEAAHGLEAVEVMHRHPQEVRVALLDVVMPKLDGHGAAVQLRQLSPGIRLIFTSGYDPLALGGGAAADEVMLSKPYQAEDLLHAVHAAFASVEGGVGGGVGDSLGA